MRSRGEEKRRGLQFISSMFSYQRLRNLKEREDSTEAHLPKRKRAWSWRRPRVRVAKLLVKKVMKRLKEGSPFLGDLFAGNYLFMQVNPSRTHYAQASY